MRIGTFVGLAAVCALSTSAFAQSAQNLSAFRLLAPVAALDATEAGKAALAGNLKATGAIQDGTSDQPALLPFADQQQQAMRDAVSTTVNASQLADGLGTALAAAYQAVATAVTPDGSRTYTQVSISPAVEQVIVYANRTTNADSAIAKNFFGNLTQQDAKPVSPAAVAIMDAAHGKPDIFGRAYGLPLGSTGASTFGNARPFQTEPHLISYRGKTMAGAESNSVFFLRGPQQDLTGSPSFPSGHATYGYTSALVLALLVPQRYPEMVARGAEYGNSRIVIGAHYAMDVIGGRTLALYDMAQLLAGKPGYVSVDRGGMKIDDFRKAIALARADLTKVLEAGCGGAVAACAAKDTTRFADPAKTAAFYASTLTYGIPPAFAASPVDVAKAAPEAGYLLTTAFPHLTLAQANAILTATEAPGGGFLDNGSPLGVYSRLDLYRAAAQARDGAPRRK